MTLQGNEELLKRLFNKVYSAILSEKIFCPAELAVILASYACQAKFKSALAIRDPIPPVKDLLPKSIIDNHNLSIKNWETRISTWHMKLQGVSFLDSIVEYLDIAQDVELYGASIFEVEIKSGCQKWISIDSVGLNIYESKRKPPTQRFMWADIISFQAFDDSIEVVFTDELSKPVVFYTVNQQSANLLVDLFQGSKDLYMCRKQNEKASTYLRRSESNSSMRMRPRKLSKKELVELSDSLTVIETELPRRETNFEFAPWQVKDQLRQTKGIEAKLVLSQPSSPEIRQLQRRCADIRIFLEQDIFKDQEEQIDRPHRYRGNFTIRVGGADSTRIDGYTSDADEYERMTNEASPWRSSKPKDTTVDYKNFTASKTNVVITEKPVFVEHSQPPLPKIVEQPDNESSRTNSVLDSNKRPPSFSPDDLSTSNETYFNNTPVYPTPNSFDTVNSSGMPAIPTTNSPEPWTQSLKPVSNGDEVLRGNQRIHGQVIEPTSSASIRPPLHPKPKVCPRETTIPRTVTPDPDDEGDLADRRQDIKFASLIKIQRGNTKKRVDLFEAL